ncbi:MAG TPA: hypothetical protein VGE45_21950 [Chloroflexia bacterium]
MFALAVARRAVGAWGPVAALMLVSVGLLVGRWQVVPVGAVRLDLGDPQTSASHFYGVEQSEGRGLRWSRTLSAVSLPALASSQVVSVTVNPARPQSGAPVPFRLLVGTRVVGEFQAQPGWNTYTVTVGPRFDSDVRLIVESDTFYPGAGDSRRLGLAVSELAAARQSSRFGLVWPPQLWLVLAGLAPVLGFFCGKITSRRLAPVAGGVGAVMPAIWSLVLPASVALPLAAWVGGAVGVALLLRYAYSWLSPDNGLYRAVERVGNSRWEVPLVSAFVGLLSLVMTWPLVGRIASAMPGWPADNFAFLYKVWWFRTAIFEEGRWPLFDPNSYAPFGFDLAQGEPTLLNTLPGAVIGAISNDVVAYNVLALLTFVVSGIGGYLLVKELSASKAAGLLGAVAFAFCPYRMTQLAGHLQLLGTGWIALTFYFAERTLRTRKIKHGAFMGLSLALTALGAWYYAYMVGLAVAVYFVVRWWMLRREAPLREMVKPVLAAAVTLMLVAGPVAVPSLSLWGQGRLTHSAKAADEHSAAPLDYIIPNTLHPVWGEASIRAHAEENVLETSLYLGLVAVVIAIAGWVIGRRRARSEERGARAVWLGVLVGAIMLSLGLTLHGLEGQVLVGAGEAKSPITLPGRLLYDWLPLYSSMRAYARFGVLAALAVVVLMGMGWAALLRQPGWARRGQWLTLVATCLLLVDFWGAPYAWGTTRVEPTEASKFLATAPPGLVMQMPLASSQSGPALFWGTYYGKPISYGYDTFEPAEWRAARDTLQEFPDDATLDLLKSWGVRYIVVSANAYGPDWLGYEEFFKRLPRLRHLGDFQEKRTWDVDPRVLDARPDLVDYVLPDTLAVFELVR